MENLSNDPSRLSFFNTNKTSQKDRFNHVCQNHISDLTNQAMEQLSLSKTGQESEEKFKQFNLIIANIKKESSYSFNVKPQEKSAEEVLISIYKKYQEQIESLGFKLKPVILMNNSTVSSVSHEIEEEVEFDPGKKSPIENQKVQKQIFGNKISAREKIHPAYDQSIFFSENFFPKGKTPIPPGMLKISKIYFDKDSSGNITSAYIDDPLNEWELRDHELYDLNADNHNLHLEENNSKKFHTLISQVKFLDGKTSGYTKEEITSLKDWLTASGPKEMKRHMLDDILQFRFKEKQEFESSQLGELFKTLPSS